MKNVQFFWKDAAPVSLWRTGVSLHGHTMHSEECLNFLPRYLHYVPGVSQIVSRYERGPRAIDFARGWWTPPLTPACALRLEQDQIAKLGLTAPGFPHRSRQYRSGHRPAHESRCAHFRGVDGALPSHHSALWDSQSARRVRPPVDGCSGGLHRRAGRAPTAGNSARNRTHARIVGCLESSLLVGGGSKGRGSSPGASHGVTGMQRVDPRL